MNGRAPNLGQIAANASLSPSDPNPVLAEANAKLNTFLENKTLVAEFANNVYKAHHDAVEGGMDDWSEIGYVHHKVRERSGCLVGAGLMVR